MDWAEFVTTSIILVTTSKKYTYYVFEGMGGVASYAKRASGENTGTIIYICMGRFMKVALYHCMWFYCYNY